MTGSQRRALLTLLGLLVAGHGVRWLLLSPGDAPGAVWGETGAAQITIT